MANKFQVKRTTVTGRTPNTTNSGNTHFIDTGELALNLTDGKMFSSNGTVYFEIGANLANQIVTGTVNAASFTVGTNFIANTTQVTIAAGVLLSANGGVGTAGQVLASNGSTGSPYWATASGGGSTVTDDTTTNASRYVLFANQTSGTLTDEYVSSTKMYFNPSTGKLNATSFNSLSDVFSKENIKTLDNAISKILMMRGVSFTWKGTDDKSIGLIAQEVEHILPEVVSTSEDGIKSVSYDSIIGLLIEGIKEQQQTIEQMKSSINILLDKISTEGERK